MSIGPANPFQDGPVPIDGARLRNELSRLRMPAELFASVARMAPDEVTAICEGRTRQVNQSVLQRIAQAANVSAAYLAGQVQPSGLDGPLAPPVVNPADAARIAAAQRGAQKALPSDPLLRQDARLDRLGQLGPGSRDGANIPAPPQGFLCR